nr:hypothetical protein [Tanacetum cinerariifolium]
MAILVILVSSDSSEVIASPTTKTDTIVIPTKIPIIAPTIPPSPDYTPASLDYSPTSDTEFDPYEDPSSYHIPPLLAISPFLSSADDTTDNDTLDTPPLLTHDTPFTEVTSFTQRSPVIPYRRVMILVPGQHIPHGHPYRYHLNRPIHMMTMRKRVGPLPIQQLAVRHYVDHSSSDYFYPDDSARDSSLNSSSEASSDFHSDASSDSSSRHSLSDHSSPDLPSTSAMPSRKRHRSPMTFVPTLPPISGALSPIRDDLIPSPKRVKDSGYLADVERVKDSGYLADIEVDPRETSLRDDVMSEMGTRGSVEVRVERVTHPVMLEDTPEPAQEERAIECTYETLGSLGHRIVGVESTVTVLTERIIELERDNRRLRDTASVESQRWSRTHLEISPSVTLLCCRKMPNTRSRASMTHEEVEKLVARRVAKEMEAREAAMNLEPLNENGDEQEGENEGNANGGNEGNINEGNGDGDGGNRENGN